MGGLLMAESLAQKSRTRCVVFITGEGPELGMPLGALWTRDIHRQLPDEKFEKVFSSQGESNDLIRMRLADIVLVGGENQMAFSHRTMLEIGMAIALEKPIYVFSKKNPYVSDRIRQVTKHVSASLHDTVEMIRVEAEEVLARKKRNARNT